jgi:hypothetical protein
MIRDKPLFSVAKRREMEWKKLIRKSRPAGSLTWRYTHAEEAKSCCLVLLIKWLWYG